MLTRRQLLRLTPAGLLSLGLWPGALAAAEKEMKEIRFAVFNDLHVVDQVCADWLEGIVKDVKTAKEKHAFVILAGDLSEHGTAPQLTPVRDLFKALGAPVHVVIGNHDWKTNA